MYDERHDATGSVGGRGAAAGLMIRSDVRIELATADDNMRMNWGRGPLTPQSAISAECASDAEWWAFPGGFWVAEPGCYRVDVTVESGTPTRVEIDIGAPCEGQQPPAS